MGSGNWGYFIPIKWSYGPLLRTGFPGPHLVGFVRIHESTTDQRTEHNFDLRTSNWAQQLSELQKGPA